MNYRRWKMQVKELKPLIESLLDVKRLLSIIRTPTQANGYEQITETNDKDKTTCQDNLQETEGKRKVI